MGRVSSFMIYSATVALIVNFAAAQTVHVVGDSLGWNIPPNTSFYSNWASSKTFMLGDILEFNFVTNQHDLVRVPKASYDDCSDDDAIGSFITTGPVNITLDSAGDRHYICTFGRHCESGQKLSITVVASSTPPAGGAAPPPSSTTAPPATPTTPSPATPDQPDACSPDADAPTAGTPAPSSRPTLPLPDSASASLASGFLLITMLASVVLLF